MKLNPKEAPKGYVARETRKTYGCAGCVFYDPGKCPSCQKTKASCMSFDRMDGCDVIFVQAPKRPRQATAPEGKDICSRCGRVQTYGTMKAISEDSFDLLCTKCRRPRPKATFEQWWKTQERKHPWLTNTHVDKYANACEQIARRAYAAGRRSKA